ncbi:MAG: hypothetical protein KF867_06685 [Cryobacterium sp.]|nr:hypothetical protein [Cryobacterium sp.]
MIKAAGGINTVRRLVCYLLLGILVWIAAIGLSGLGERILSARDSVYTFGMSDLAQSLSFSLIATPLACVLWWLCWRRPVISIDRNSLLWPTYLLIMTNASLLISTFNLYSWAGNNFDGSWRADGLATAIIWGLVWVWHYWMWRHPSISPTRMIGSSPAVSWTIGVWQFIASFGFCVMFVVDNAIATITGSQLLGMDWRPLLHALPWVVGGLLVWWWHWYRAGVKSQRTAFSSVLLVLLSPFSSIGMVTVGLSLAFYVMLRLVVALDDSLLERLEPTGLALAFGLVGALVWVFHRNLASGKSEKVQQASRFTASGVALAGFASGFGVTLNALLASLSPTLIHGDDRITLLAGLSFLIVGGILWWVFWAPIRVNDPSIFAVRKIYLVVIFGISALTAVITLLVIAFQVFMFFFDGGYGSSLIERSRHAIGIFAATVLVATYHYVLWKQDRKLSGSTTPVKAKQVLLVSDSVALAESVRELSGAKVELLKQSGEGIVSEPVDSHASAITEAIASSASNRVLVISKAKGKFEVIQLEE